MSSDDFNNNNLLNNDGQSNFDWSRFMPIGDDVDVIFSQFLANQDNDTTTVEDRLNSIDNQQQQPPPFANFEKHPNQSFTYPQGYNDQPINTEDHPNQHYQEQQQPSPLANIEGHPNQPYTDPQSYNDQPSNQHLQFHSQISPDQGLLVNNNFNNRFQSNQEQQKQHNPLKRGAEKQQQPKKKKQKNFQDQDEYRYSESENDWKTIVASDKSIIVRLKGLPEWIVPQEENVISLRLIEAPDIVVKDCNTRPIILQMSNNGKPFYHPNIKVYAFVGNEQQNRYGLQHDSSYLDLDGKARFEINVFPIGVSDGILNFPLVFQGCWIGGTTGIRFIDGCQIQYTMNYYHRTADLPPPNIVGLIVKEKNNEQDYAEVRVNRAKFGKSNLLYVGFYDSQFKVQEVSNKITKFGGEGGDKFTVDIPLIGKDKQRPIGLVVGFLQQNGKIKSSTKIIEWGYGQHLYPIQNESTLLTTTTTTTTTTTQTMFNVQNFVNQQPQ